MYKVQLIMHLLTVSYARTSLIAFIIYIFIKDCFHLLWAEQKAVGNKCVITNHLLTRTNNCYRSRSDTAHNILLLRNKCEVSIQPVSVTFCHFSSTALKHDICQTCAVIPCCKGWRVRDLQKANRGWANLSVWL